MAQFTTMRASVTRHKNASKWDASKFHASKVHASKYHRTVEAQFMTLARVVPQIVASIITYDCNIFIVRAIGSSLAM